ncbi:hypothetical protein QVD17_37958 [Tagetes erecta]|uniref:Reverse transcriptase domain-containing protein n=1 Tax=Tagetes erecta TaxID=13708 RepID=A0AAD8NJ03_TARER|nr:hypothetical protein QVD17_37958 [Tagetes erecta]
MTAIAISQFHGRDDEDAPAHLSRLARIVSNFKLQGASVDAIYLHLFPFSLADVAIFWLDSQAEGTLTPWALVKKFYNGLTYETRARFDTSRFSHRNSTPVTGTPSSSTRGAPPGYQANYNNNNNQGVGSSFGNGNGSEQAIGQGSSDSIHRIEQMLVHINLMPYSLYEKLGLGELTPTRMSLSLADKSVKYPRGIVENLLVKVDKFVFPVDFVVLDMEADAKVPIILGRPFLRTAHAIIDVFKGKITLHVGEDIAIFKIPEPIENVKCWDNRVLVIDAEDRWEEGYESGNMLFTKDWAEVRRLVKLKCGDPGMFEDTPDDAG